MTPPVGPVRQVGALLALRWQMLRAPGARLAACVLALALAWLVGLALTAADAVHPALLDAAVTLAPQAYLGFGVLALLAPMAAGGSHEVVPPDQLLPFPVRPSTAFLGGLLLAPLNLVWLLQLVVLAVETAVLTAGGYLLLGLGTTVVYVALVTVLGQSLAWVVAGLRQTRRGRQAVVLATALLVGTGALLAAHGYGAAALEVSLAGPVVYAVVEGGAGYLLPWGVITAGLLVTTALSVRLGVTACGWALRRPGDAVVRTGSVRRRRNRPTPLRLLVAVDRASVWRAPALRRGALVLTLLPAALALGAIPWSSLAVLPGLVAAGAGLLFGVNVFCLDASGALWLASLPHDPLLVARAKLVVLTETVLGAAVLTVALAALRTPAPPTPAEVTAVVAAVLTGTAVVVAAAFGRAVRSPHRADLRGPRDAPAPPGSLALASVRLAAPAVATGLLCAVTAASGRWQLPLLAALPVLALAALSLRRSLRRWCDPLVRARVVQTVAAG